MTDNRFLEIHLIKNSCDEFSKRDMADFDNTITIKEEKEYQRICYRRQKEFEMSFR
jgi:hypothetical protein